MPAAYATSLYQGWETPPSIYTALLRFEKRTMFDLDPCCSRPNIPAKRRYTLAEDGLLHEWRGLAYINPPFDDVERWAKRAAWSNAWCLLPARVETDWWQGSVFWSKRRFIVFLRGRVRYLRDGKPGCPAFPSALVYFGDDWQSKAKRWHTERPLRGWLHV